MNRRFAVLTVLLISLTAAQSAAQENTLSAANAQAVDKAVKAEIDNQKLVGVALGIIQNGKIVYLKGYGLANEERKIPVETSTVFNWASNSKPLAALLAMQLAQNGQLDLTTDVRKYVPEFPDKKVKITMRDLLCHQSGIPHYTNGKIVRVNGKYATIDPFADPVIALDTFSPSDLIFKPCEKSDYSSYAYILVSAVVQRAGKEPFNKQVLNRVVKPLGLKSLTVDTNATKPNWATGYMKKNDKVVPAPEYAHYWKHGGGAFKSDVRDFARWAQALINRELVNEATEKLMWTPQATSDGKATTWGLGFSISGTGDRLRVSHNGKQQETTTRIAIYPRAKHGVVVMCNCDFADLGKVSTAVYTALSAK